ncbi:MAG: hypothetical protein JWQ74_1863 [Marmoricola sp.]|nr:hypothetical protein [Marmoricola sp.]
MSSGVMVCPLRTAGRTSLRKLTFRAQIDAPQNHLQFLRDQAPVRLSLKLCATAVGIDFTTEEGT